MIKRGYFILGCGGKMVASSGNISYLNRPSLPTFSIKCDWRIYIPNEQMTQISFQRFDFPGSPDCGNTVVTIEAKWKWNFCQGNPPDLSPKSYNTKRRYIHVSVIASREKWTRGGFQIFFRGQHGM